MIQKIELRVHAGAASNRSDDNRNRGLAEAYLGFIGRRIDYQHTGSDHDTTQHEAAQVPRSEDGTLDEDSSTGSITTLHHEEPTFIEDTLLAYNALESQLNTCSLTVAEALPLKRQLADDDEDSPWPTGLDQHSPQKALEDPRKAPRSSPPSFASGVEQHISKKPRLPQKPFRQPVCKSFQAPLRRVAALDAAPSSAPVTSTFATPEPRQRTSSEFAVSQSSYLDTPLLATPAQLRHRKGDIREPTHGELPRTPVPVPLVGKLSPSKIPDYRERTPRAKPSVPYMPLPKGSDLGLAFIGASRDLVRTPNSSEANRQSQISDNGVETTSELPTSYSLSDLTSQSSRARLRASQRSTSDPAPLASNSHDSAEHHGSTRSASQPVAVSSAPYVEFPHPLITGRPAIRHVNKQDAGPPKPAPAERVDAAAAIRKDEELQSLKAAGASDPPLVPDVSGAEAPNSYAPTPIELSDLSLNICPPEPVVAVKEFSTHITIGLKLLDNEELGPIWKPVSVSRNLLPLERGHWLVRTSKWAVHLQCGFWRFLQRFVGSGQAGWGVWCTRESEPQAAGAERHGSSLGDVRVYCWGEVVKHVYFLLYVASQSKVRKIGLQWLDAGEEVVLQMRSG